MQQKNNFPPPSLSLSPGRKKGEKMKRSNDEADAEGNKRARMEDMSQRMFQFVTDDEDVGKLEALMKESGLEGEDQVALLEDKNNEGKTLMDVAIERQNVRMVVWLLSLKHIQQLHPLVREHLELEGHPFTLIPHFGKVDLLECYSAIDGGPSELLNAVDSDRRTVLHLAVLMGNIPVIDWLLSKEGRALGFTSILAGDKDGGTALHLGVSIGRLDACQAVVNGCSAENGERAAMLNAVKNNGRTVLHAAMMGKRPSIISWLFSDCEGGGRASGFDRMFAVDDRGISALHLIAIVWDLPSLQALVDGCKKEKEQFVAMLNGVDKDGETVLHYAARCSKESMMAWLLSEWEGEGRALGFNRVLTADKNGQTVLHSLARNGNVKACQALINGCRVDNGERSAMLNAVDNKGWNALHIAASWLCSREKSTAIVRWLLCDSEGGGLTQGFDISNIFASTANGDSVLHLIADNTSVRRLDIVLSRCSTIADRLRLFQAMDKHGWTIFHRAASRTKPRFIAHLLRRYPEESKLTIDMRDRRGMTVLHRAIIGGLDLESRSEWHGYCARDLIAALLGFDIEGEEPEEDEEEDEEEEEEEEEDDEEEEEEDDEEDEEEEDEEEDDEGDEEKAQEQDQEQEIEDNDDDDDDSDDDNDDDDEEDIEKDESVGAGMIDESEDEEEKEAREEREKKEKEKKRANRVGCDPNRALKFF